MTLIVLHDSILPDAGIEPDSAELALWHEATTLTDVTHLAGELANAGAGDVLVYLHGRFVAGECWQAITAFLQRGGNLVSIGNNPFSRCNGVEQAGYFREIDIHEYLAIDTSKAKSVCAARQFPLLAGRENLFDPQAATCGLVLMPTKHKDCPDQSSSSGPMDARIYPLLEVMGEGDMPIAAPVVLIEHHRGEFAGGRWVMANIDPDERFWQQGGGAAILEWARFAAQGATEIWIKPDFACYLPGEVPTITVQLENAHRQEDWCVELVIEHGGEVLHQQALQLPAQPGLRTARLTLPLAARAGRYQIRARAESVSGEVQQLAQGFWGRDEALLAQGTRLAAGRDYFERDGQPVPVVGMTYMASDVHRKFLQLPNVAVWHDDMATLAGMGVNYIRTGIWTAWRQVMFADGHANEAALRAVDAFILTATELGLETCFTFFSFTPEAWEGANPYLDPRARTAQKRFIASIVGRHAHSQRVHWDLINEPSMFDPARIFLGPRTLRDPFETQAFRQWLQARNPELAHWRARWDETGAKLASWNDVIPPDPVDVGFNTTEILPKQHGIWLDYTLFTQDMLADWAADLGACIKAAAPGVMVTVGQDEALGMQRPSPFFFARAVDYTNVHSWWLNDDLAWDSFFSKTPNKPSLIQETGIMHVETPAGRSKRSERELAELLERKYAFAFAAGGAGAVQWIWNINYHMDNINESHIGACRADGTAKPEVAVTRDFGRFFARVAPLLRGRRLEDVAVMFPFSNDYGNRRFAMEATQKLTRTLQYTLKQSFRVFSEYDPAPLEANPAQLIMVPSAHVMTAESRLWLMQQMQEAGVTVLLTGPYTLSENWLSNTKPGFGDLGVANLMRDEWLQIGETRYRASFAGEKTAKLLKGVYGESQMNKVAIQQYGKGKAIWCPLPLEMCSEEDTLAALYRQALHEAGIEPDFLWLSEPAPGVFAQKLSYAEGALWILVNESSLDESVCLQDAHSGCQYRCDLPAGRAMLFASDAAGALLASLRDENVEVSV